MIIFNLFKICVATIAFLNVATAHTDLSPKQLADYHQNLKRDSESLGRCLLAPEMKEHNARMLVHRNQILHRIRKTRGINIEAENAKRDTPAVTKWATINHFQGTKGDRDPQKLFGFHWGESTKLPATGCALTPNSIYGPYWREGQPERQRIADGQQGIYLRLAMQVIDTANCKPIDYAKVDVWHANAMGEYSDKMTGYLRGWQSTSYQGTVDFDTLFPGHYGGRASHIHVSVRPQHGSRVAHIGQIYFDQWLRDLVETTKVYKDNRNSLTSNLKDDLLPYDASSSFDPFVRWSGFSSNLYDGVLAWITLGVNTTDYSVEQPPPGKRDMIDWHLD